jgi:hypothetical protein
MEDTSKHTSSGRHFPFAEAEETYWRNEFRTRPYVRPGATYEEYSDAYRYGWESRAANKAARSWDTVSGEIEKGWEKAKRSSRLAWTEAKDAVRDGWHHVERALPGDADADGR